MMDMSDMNRDADGTRAVERREYLNVEEDRTGDAGAGKALDACLTR